MEKDNVKKFIELYNVLDDLLRDYFKEFSRSLSMINRYINTLEKSSSFEKHRKARKLNMIRILRNNLVHEFDLNSDKLINVSDETIQFLEDEIESLKNPITAYDVCTKLEHLYHVDEEDLIRPVLDNMSKRGFTQVPVLSSDNKLIGVFSPNVLFKYLAKNGIPNQTPLKINDVKEFLPINNHVSERYAFIDKHATMDEVMDLFDEAHRINKKLVAIFVTRNGNDNQELLGMIVPYDLIKSDK